ncbi:MAG TPA: helix-turn-helix transcriptional regulator [Hyphomicrobiaceae bacterium]|jgi:transcriptional regulator with XRE-family HTH domain|nr:helix-turn-helix transcriptional regulator [Hyphomicrobiaceae bacterium]
MGKKPDPVDVLVGQNIKLHRLAKSMSQEELAQKLGLTFQQLQKYERGINRVGGGRLFRIASILGIEISSFFEGAERPERVPGQSFSPLSLISDPQPFRLVQAFSRISDPEMRRTLVSLVEKIADEVH